jgi:hypothetical protein
VNIIGAPQAVKALKNSHGHPAVRPEMEKTVEIKEFYTKTMSFNVMFNCKGRQL